MGGFEKLKLFGLEVAVRSGHFKKTSGPELTVPYTFMQNARVTLDLILVGSEEFKLAILSRFSSMHCKSLKRAVHESIQVLC